MLIIVAAARTFGKFDDGFLENLHSEIQSFAKQEEIGHFVHAPEGIIVMESDVLAPDPVRKGGLVRADKVSYSYVDVASLGATGHSYITRSNILSASPLNSSLPPPGNLDTGLINLQ